MQDKKVRTRFAPSPTGYMHVGNLRTALYAYLTAKHSGGTFILRIEDTDQERYVEGAVDVIYNTCREAGLLWDEGPDVGGPVGPYVQSERMGLFKQYAEQLVADGKAYSTWAARWAPMSRASGWACSSSTPSSWWQTARPTTASAPASGWTPSTPSSGPAGR